MKKVTILIIIIISLTAFLNAQITENYTLHQTDLIIQQNGMYDEIIITNEYSFTDEIGNPQLPIKIISYVLPYNSTVLDIQVNSLTETKLNGNHYIYRDIYLRDVRFAIMENFS